MDQNEKQGPARQDTARAGFSVDKLAYHELMNTALDEGPVAIEAAGEEEVEVNSGHVASRAKISAPAVYSALWMKVCIGIAFLSLLTYVGARIINRGDVEFEDADNQLRLSYGPKYYAVAAMNEITSPAVNFSGPTDPALEKAVNNFNQSMDTLSGEAGDQISAENFRFVGSEATYISDE